MGMEWLTGSKNEMKQMPNMSPEQMGFLNQMLGMLQGQGGQGMNSVLQYYMNLMQGGPEATSAFEAPYMRQFNEEIAPGIAERYAGVGGLSSSAFPMAMAQAGSGLQEKLASLRSGLQQQGAQGFGNLYQGLGQMGLSAQPYNTYMQQGSPGMLGYGMQGLGMGLGGGFGGFGTSLGLGGANSLMKHFGLGGY